MIRPLLFLFLLTGCFCYKGPVSEYGQFRKHIEPKNFVVDQSLYEKIDTTVVYEEIATINRNYYYITNNSQGKSYLKFYANGKISSFLGIGFNKYSGIYDPEYEFTRNDFNPAKSRMGYFFKKNDKIVSNILVINQCNSEILKSEITLKNDTLILTHSNPSLKNVKNIYIKKSIPVELIEGWQPDW